MDNFILKAGTALYRVLQAVGLPPSVLAWRNPLKLREYVAVTSKVHLTASSSVLDFGCGTGLHAQSIAKRCHAVVGIDTSRGVIERARQLLRGSQVRDRVKFICSDLHEARFPDGTFDMILSFCVLEHVANLDDVLMELRRITKPGGWLHVSVDCLGTVSDPAVIRKHQQDHFVARYFTADSLREHLYGSGWNVVEIEAILKGEVARQQFESLVRNWPRKHRLKNLLKAPGLYQTIKCEDDEARSESQMGLMLVARATKG
jgi:ubiquinone/menaquinone biosynthesis C-methylase UbiE